jgi:Legume lectin domain
LIRLTGSLLYWLQAQKALGASGQGLGYAGVPTSIGIEFDTYNNGASDGNSSNHIAIDEDGSLNDAALANVYGVQTCGFSLGYTGIGCMSNGDKWTVNIGYNGSDLSVTAKDGSAAPFTAISSYPINLSSLLDTNAVYISFTGSTGGGRENEDILNWAFANTSTLPALPEPASLALLSAGVAAVGFCPPEAAVSGPLRSVRRWPGSSPAMRRQIARVTRHWAWLSGPRRRVPSGPCFACGARRSGPSWPSAASRTHELRSGAPVRGRSRSAGTAPRAW